MRASVIIRSKDEADRLRLTLRSLSRQSMPAEVVVVNDGSTDHTDAVIDEAAERLALVKITHRVPLGRSEAANAGGAQASGDLLIFLDGDTLAGPDFSTDIVGTFLYRTFFGYQLQSGDRALGSAIAAVMFLIILTGVCIYLFGVQTRLRRYQF